MKYILIVNDQPHSSFDDESVAEQASRAINLVGHVRNKARVLRLTENELSADLLDAVMSADLVVMSEGPAKGKLGRILDPRADNDYHLVEFNEDFLPTQKILLPKNTLKPFVW